MFLRVGVGNCLRIYICADNMTLSVVIATYNGEKFLREQLVSVLAQTLLPDEIIVSDDGSTDGTWAILEEYRSKYPKLIRLYANKGQHGPHENFKHAFQYVTCDLVAPCDQDDIWLPEKLERSVAEIKDDVWLVYCQERRRTEDGKDWSVYNAMPPLRKCIFGDVVPGHLLVFRREALDVFSVPTEITFDLGVVLYVAIAHRGIGIDYIGCIWRRHANVVTTEYSDYKTYYVEKMGKWRKLFKTLRMLRKGDKSEVIAKRMDSMYTILEHFKGRKEELQLTQLMGKQTIGSMLQACYLNMRIAMREDECNRMSLRKKIGMMSYAFCYPAKYWYDYHNHQRL